MVQTANKIATAWNTQPLVETAVQACRHLKWSVVPMYSTSNNNKKPYVSWKPLQEQAANEDTIRAWEKEYHPKLWGLITGKVSGVITLDFDGEAGRALIEQYGFNPHRRTGSGGYQQDFKHPGWYVKTVNNKSSADRPWAKQYPGLDIRGDGGIAVIAGANNKGPYTWLRDPSPDELSSIPEEMRKALGLFEPPKATGAAARLLEEALGRAADDGRNNAGFWLARRLRDRHLSIEVARAIMSEYQRRVQATNAKGEEEEYSPEEATNSLESAYSDHVFTPTIYSLRDLLNEQLEPPRWAVRNLIPEGLTLLAGAPKMGKSWMTLQIALALATGGQALGAIEVERGDVLYLALEDNKRRLQSRALQLLSENWRDNLGCFDYVTEWARLNEGGLEAIETWLEHHPAARLVVIDTLAKVRPRRTNKGSIYDEDYADIGDLKALADKYQCAIVLIHHRRKQGASDPNDEVSGSTGLTGAADCTLVLRRERGQADAILHVSGRDVDEQKLAITFSEQTGFWKLAGDAENFRLTQERQEIIDVIHDLTLQGIQATPLEIHKGLNVSREVPKSRESVRFLLSKMTTAGDVTPSNGIYIANRTHSTNSANTANSTNSSLSNEPIESGSNGHHPVSTARAVSAVSGVSGQVPKCVHFLCMNGTNRTQRKLTGFWCPGHGGYIDEEGRPV